jgi:murein DD-endopeptidase MepM/ murein hydrolase activator NlpD
MGQTAPTSAEPYDWDERNPRRRARVRSLRPADWDWSLEVDGALARERNDHFVLKETDAFGTVPRMARPQAGSFPVHADVRERARTRARRLRRLVLAVLVAAIVIPVLVLALDSASPARPVPLPQADRAQPAGPPTPQVVAFQGELRLYLPIEQRRITAVGYHGVGDGALALDPVGTQANAGVLTRLLRRLFGEDKAGIRFNLMGGGGGSETAGLDIGARPGTDVYAPVDGTVVGISDHVVSGRRFGVRIDIQPSGSPGLVVSLRNLDPDAAISVGSTVAASRTKIGNVIDLSAVETSTLAEYTQDRGQHVHLEVRPAVNLSVP